MAVSVRATGGNGKLYGVDRGKPGSLRNGFFSSDHG
jgi:hypothetical protein